MEMTLQRDPFSPKGTTGALHMAGTPFCWTLERPDAQFNPEWSCIPAGRYRVVIYDSPHFGRPMPLLVDVPGRAGIEMHWGDFVENSEGCILVGSAKSTQDDGTLCIWNTRDTFEKLFEQVSAAQADECWITIEDANAR